jgi:hypothetical protein
MVILREKKEPDLHQALIILDTFLHPICSNCIKKGMHLFKTHPLPDNISFTTYLLLRYILFSL